MILAILQRVIGTGPSTNVEILEGLSQSVGVKFHRDQTQRMLGSGGQGAGAAGRVTGDVVEHDTLAGIGSAHNGDDQRIVAAELWNQLADQQFVPLGSLGPGNSQFL
ncbi:MAG: hypothetical protein CMJ65_14090 [Planctomycetaceae bacterium]|nr:hypothetical protein [Planctomycetaceae bacterium]